MNTWNLKCQNEMPFSGKETSKRDVKVTVSFCSCKKRETTERTNGDYQTEMSYRGVEGTFPTPVSFFYS